MLKSAQTRIASVSASRVTPTASTASASAEASSPGASVIFSRNPSVSSSCGEIGAERQSVATAFQISSPSAYDATAPWAFVQKWQLLRSDVKPANSSRSPGDQWEGTAAP